MEDREIPRRSKKAFVPFIVAIVLLGGLLAYVFYNDQAQLNAYQEQVQDLKTKLNKESSLVNSLNAQISKYKKEIQGYQNEIKNMNSNVGNYQSKVQELQDKINRLNAIIDLNCVDYVASSQIINLPAGGNHTWTIYPSYAGYVIVDVQSSTTPNTYVKVIVNSEYGSWTFQEGVGSSGSCTIPVLPGVVEIIVGNTNWFQGSTMTVSIEYHYRRSLHF